MEIGPAEEVVTRRPRLESLLTPSARRLVFRAGITHTWVVRGSCISKGSTRRRR